MRIQILCVMSAVAACSTVAAYAQDNPKQAVAGAAKAGTELTAKQKASYGIGMNIGRSLTKQGLKAEVVDVSLLARKVT